MVDFGPEQGMSEFETAVVVRHLRGFQMSENAALGQKMPFMDGHSLYALPGWDSMPGPSGCHHNDPIPPVFFEIGIVIEIGIERFTGDDTDSDGDFEIDFDLTSEC